MWSGRKEYGSIYQDYKEGVYWVIVKCCFWSEVLGEVWI